MNHPGVEDRPLRSWARRVAVGVLLLLAAGPVRAAEPPAWLPRYDLDIQLDVAGARAQVRQKITWTNRHDAPASELVFNAHSHYEIPADEVAKLAKTLELMRLFPSDSLVFDGPALQVREARYLSGSGRKQPEPPTDSQGNPLPRPPRSPSEEEPPPKPLPPRPLEFRFRDDNPTALVVPLPEPVGKGESVTIELDFAIRLPPKQGRWGQWNGITFLVQWLPVLSYYNEAGWQPTPFIPWHQPFFNEAGIYRAKVELPADHKLACSGHIVAQTNLDNGNQQVEIEANGVRDFALLASARYEEFAADMPVPTPAEPNRTVRLKVMAFPEHEHYARVMLRISQEAIAAYSKWFGPYPYPVFTIAESYFGWNGNECGGLVMIDGRVFGMPRLAEGYVDYLVSHEICHQWWYNVVGTNGYAETWMDEGLATYFSHRLLNEKHGKNNDLLHMPRYLEWLPTIKRENYRHYGLYGVMARGEASATVQEMPGFRHVVNLFAMTYDRGSRIVGLMEDRLGEAAFLDFMRLVYEKNAYQVLQVADFQEQLEEYTGRSWDGFFHQWLHSCAVTDWCIENVDIEGSCQSCLVLCRRRKFGKAPVHVTVYLRQKGEICEPTVLGFCLDDDHTCQIRLPVGPYAEPLQLNDPPAVITAMPDGRVKVQVTLPRKPKQIIVDPDQVLLDADPSNNCWKPRIRWRLTPLYTSLEETDLTNDYDRWNVIAGPWVYFPAFDDPWFTRSTMAGARVGVYRTQQFNAGIYAAYRTDYRDVVMGADAMLDHWPFPKTQVGIIGERRIGSVYDADQHANRAVLYGRYIFDYTSSLYLQPMRYVELFGTIQDNFLPVPRETLPGAERFDQMNVAGIHYHVNYLTPYWDPEAGYSLDLTYGTGAAIFGQHKAFNQVNGQFTFVKALPEFLGPLSKTRMAYRVFGAGGLPDEGEYFPLGGQNRFRGYDMPQRQGSAVWVGTLEWRVPVLKGLNWDVCDHIAGIRNVNLAAFYDVGDAYLMGKSLDGVAHALGGGLRVDVAWFGFLERSILRFDLAKTINDDTPVQVWLGFMHPF